MKKVEMKGMKFGRLTVLKEEGRDSRGNVTWLCRCDHGGVGRPKRLIVSGIKLREGSTRSCRCLLRESSQANGKKFLRHGLSQSPLYQVWRNMKSRCYNLKARDYSYYGARGIAVCESWMTSDNFFEWAFKSGYAEGLTIERKDNDKDYCPENCYWIPMSLQPRNKRNTIYIVYRGKRRGLIECCEETGMKRTVAIDRIKRGWNPDDALLIPISVNRHPGPHR